MNEVLSELDAQPIIAMVESWEELDLEWRCVSEDDPRLCSVQRKDKGSPDSEDLKQQRPIAVLDGVSKEANSIYAEGKVVGTGATGAAQTPKKKVKRLNDTLRSLKFKKNSFPPEDIANTLSLGVGDVVICNVYQYRRTGAFVVEDIKVLERKERPPAAAVVSDGGEDGAATPAQKRKGLTGFVTKVDLVRQFGFIALVDEDSGNRSKDMFFFHLSEIVAGVAGGGSNTGAEVAQDGGGRAPPGSRNKTPGRSEVSGGAVRKDDEVRFYIGKSAKNGKLAALNVSMLPRGTLKMAPANSGKPDLSKQCVGYILMEPSHTSFVNTPSHAIAPQSGPPTGAGAAPTGGGSRWDNVRDDAAASKNQRSESNANEGVILLLSDPLSLFSPKPKGTDSPKKIDGEGGDVLLEKDAALNNSGSNAVEASSTSAESNTAGGADAKSNNAVKAAKTSDDADSTQSVPVFVAGTRLHYRTSAIVAVRGFTSGANSRRNDGPRRGDLVTFSKPRGATLAKDIRVEKPSAATSVRGVLTDIRKESDAAVFTVSSDNDTETRYDIRLTDVVSCDKALLKDKEQVDGILHEGQIFGGKGASLL